MGDVPALEHHRPPDNPCPRRLDPEDDLAEHGLARAGLADQPVHFAGRDVQRHAAQDRCGVPLPAGDRELEIPHREEGPRGSGDGDPRLRPQVAAACARGVRCTRFGGHGEAGEGWCRSVRLSSFMPVFRSRVSGFEMPGVQRWILASAGMRPPVRPAHPGGAGRMQGRLCSTVQIFLIELHLHGCWFDRSKRR